MGTQHGGGWALTLQPCEQILTQPNVLLGQKGTAQVWSRSKFQFRHLPGLALGLAKVLTSQNLKYPTCELPV